MANANLNDAINNLGRSGFADHIQSLNRAYRSNRTPKQNSQDEAKESQREVKAAKRRLALERANERKLAAERKKTLMEELKERTAANREMALEQMESAIASADTASEKLKAGFKAGAKYAGTVIADAAVNLANNIGSAMSESVEKYLGTYTQYMSKIEARIQGAYSNMSYETLNDLIRSNTAGNPYVKYTDVLDKLAQAVDLGIASNLAQRAFLATVSEKIATTFDAFDSNLLRLIRIQRTDSTAARLGMEAELTKLFNYYFSDTSYLSDAFNDVSAALMDLSSQLTYSTSVELEYMVQKWLGSLGSVGVSESTLSSIASAINALGSGNVEYLTSNSELQNLIVMAANRAGLSYSNMLVNGVNSNDINSLLYGMVSYIQDVTSGTNNVVKAKYAELFGLTVADVNAFGNLTNDVISSIYNSAMTYNDALVSLDSQLSELPNRIHFSEQVENVIENLMAATGIGVANSKIAYATYKIADLVESITGGIEIPYVTVLGSGVQLPNTIEEYVKIGVVGLSTMTSLFSAIGNWATGNSLSLSDWTGSWEKGSYSGFTSTNQLSTSSSSSGFVSNTDTTGLQQSIVDEQKASAEEISGTEEEDSEVLVILRALKSYFEGGGSTSDPLRVRVVTAASKNSASTGNVSGEVDLISLLSDILSRVNTMGTDNSPVITQSLGGSTGVSLPSGVGSEGI